MCCGNFESKPVSSVMAGKPPSYASIEDEKWSMSLNADILRTADSIIDELDKDLRRLSLDLWGKCPPHLRRFQSDGLQCLLEHPEVAYEERYVWQ